MDFFKIISKDVLDYWNKINFKLSDDDLIKGIWSCYFIPKEERLNEIQRIHDVKENACAEYIINNGILLPEDSLIMFPHPFKVGDHVKYTRELQKYYNRDIYKYPALVLNTSDQLIKNCKCVCCEFVDDHISEEWVSPLFIEYATEQENKEVNNKLTDILNSIQNKIFGGKNDNWNQLYINSE